MRKNEPVIANKDEPVIPKKPGFWSKVVQALGTALGQAKFGP